MKRKQPSPAELQGEGLPATPAAKRQHSRAGASRGRQTSSQGGQEGGAGRRPVHSPPSPADCSPAESAQKIDQAAATDVTEQQERAQERSKAAELAGEEAPAAQVPSPAQAAKQRSRAAAAQQHQQHQQHQQQHQQVASPAHSHGSMQQLADAAAERADHGSPPAGSREGGLGGGGSSEHAGHLPASRAIVRGPTFRLARGQEPPCFRIWLTLQAPCSAEDVTGGLCPALH